MSAADSAFLLITWVSPPFFLRNISPTNACHLYPFNVSSLMMTRKRAVTKRDKLLGQLTTLGGVLRGSLLERTIHHSSGCPKCARGEGHPLWVLNVGYPGGKTRQLSIRPEQVPQVRN